MSTKGLNVGKREDKNCLISIYNGIQQGPSDFIIWLTQENPAYSGQLHVHGDWTHHSETFSSVHRDTTGVLSK